MQELQDRYKKKHGTDPYKTIDIAGVPIKTPTERFMTALGAMIEYYESDYTDNVYEMLSELKQRLS